MSFGLALSVLVMLLGLGFYVWAKTRPWLQEIGRIMFFVGLFVSLLQLRGGVAVNLFSGR